jgi:hypothetical protein
LEETTLTVAAYQASEEPTPAVVAFHSQHIQAQAMEMDVLRLLGDVLSMLFH